MTQETFDPLGLVKNIKEVAEVGRDAISVEAIRWALNNPELAFGLLQHLGSSQFAKASSAVRSVPGLGRGASFLEFLFATKKAEEAEQIEEIEIAFEQQAA